jgi:hypothetical protein
MEFMRFTILFLVLNRSINSCSYCFLINFSFFDGYLCSEYFQVQNITFLIKLLFILLFCDAAYIIKLT